MAGADTSLWPVVVGGLLGGFFALVGIGTGLIGTSRRDAAQRRHEAKKRRAEKFEELVAAVYEFDQWLGVERQRAFGSIPASPEIMSPITKVHSITSVYFPQFGRLVDGLEGAASRYQSCMYKSSQQQKMAEGDANYRATLDEGYRGYAQSRNVLLEALKKYARDELR
jgi:hypothetical protein